MSSPVRSSEDVSQRVYLYEGLLGEKQTGNVPCTGRKLDSAVEEGSSELGFLLISVLLLEGMSTSEAGNLLGLVKALGGN